MLSEAEQQAVLAFSKQIDLTDTAQVLQYGAAAQKNIADFSETALSKVQTRDLGEIGDMVTSLVVELKGMDEPEKKGIAGLFRKAQVSAQEMKTKYSKAEANVDKIAAELDKHKLTLMKDVAVMDQMYEKNLAYFKELTMYILAGKQKLAEERATTLVSLRAKAQTSGLAEDAQAANDFENKCERFEKKLHDLELTRVISLQTAPQIRMIQNNDTLMMEKIPDLHYEHHSALEKPDGSDARHSGLAARHGSAAEGYGYDKSAAAKERGHAQDGDRRDGAGGRARHCGH